MVNYTDKTLDKKEKDIKANYVPIKFKNSRYKVKRIEDIFDKLFNQRRNATIVVSSKKHHCFDYRFRSYYDAYLLCMHYFPEVSFKDMYRLLQKYMKPALAKYLKSRHRDWSWDRTAFNTCPTVGRAVFSYNFQLKFPKRC